MPCGLLRRFRDFRSSAKRQASLPQPQPTHHELSRISTGSLEGPSLAPPSTGTSTSRLPFGGLLHLEMNGFDIANASAQPYLHQCPDEAAVIAAWEALPSHDGWAKSARAAKGHVEAGITDALRRDASKAIIVLMVGFHETEEECGALEGGMSAASDCSKSFGIAAPIHLMETTREDLRNFSADVEFFDHHDELPQGYRTTPARQRIDEQPAAPIGRSGFLKRASAKRHGLRSDALSPLSQAEWRGRRQTILAGGDVAALNQEHERSLLQTIAGHARGVAHSGSPGIEGRICVVDLGASHAASAVEEFSPDCHVIVVAALTPSFGTLSPMLQTPRNLQRMSYCMSHPSIFAFRGGGRRADEALCREMDSAARRAAGDDIVATTSPGVGTAS